MRTRIESNAAHVLKSVIESGKSTTEAAAALGISADLLNRLIKCNKSISLRTASRLRRAFGADAIRIIEPQANLEELRYDDY